MMGIPIYGPANAFCDNRSVVTYATVSTSMWKKKHNSVAYHRVREAVAAKILKIAIVHTWENLADLLMKPLAGSQLKQIIQKILWWQNDMLSWQVIILRGLNKYHLCMQRRASCREENGSSIYVL
jgi:hypothetical protein